MISNNFFHPKAATWQMFRIIFGWGPMRLAKHQTPWQMRAGD